MKCETVRKQLDMISDGEPLENSASNFDIWRHWRQCADCRIYYHRLKVLRRTAGELPANLPSGVRERVLSQLPNRASPQPDMRMRGIGINRRAQSTHKDREIAMYKRLVVAASVFVVTVTVGTLTARVTIPKPPGAQQDGWRESDRRHVAEVNAQINRPEVSAAFLAQAKEMRAHWRTWALQHTNELRAMLNAPTSDIQAVMLVYRALPATLREDGEGLTLQDLNKPGLPFTWQMVAKINAGQDEISPSVRDNFAHFHDISLASSMKTGATKYTLWVSGRITETSQQIVVAPNGDSLLTPHIREICPPYDELTK